MLEPLGLLDFRPLATPPKKRSKAREWTQIAMSDEDNGPGYGSRVSGDNARYYNWGINIHQSKG